MQQKTKSHLKRGSANTFGAIGYVFCSLQWLWVIVLYFSVIQPALLLLSPPAPAQTQQLPSFTFTLPSQFELIIVAIVVVLMVALTSYVLIRMPLTIAKTGRKAVHKTTEKVMPLAIKAQHKKDTKRLRELLSVKIVFVLKVLLVSVPSILAIGSLLLEELPIDYLMIVIIASGLAAFSVIFFAAQYMFAVLFRVKLSDLW